MPIYEFKCSTCDSQFDLLCTMGKVEESVSCPSCHNGAQRVLSVFSSFSTDSYGATAPVAGAGGG